MTAPAIDSQQQRPTLPYLLKGTLLPMLFVMVVTFVAAILYKINVPLVQYLVANNAQYHPAGTSAASEFSVSLIYAVPIIFFTFGMAYVVKKKRTWILPIIIASSLCLTSAFIVILAYWWMPLNDAISMAFGLAALFVFSMVSFKDFKPITRLGPLLRLPFQVWLGTGTAVIMVLLFPTITLLALCGIMAGWDLYAVLKGPLKTVAGEMKAPDDKSRVTIGKMLMAQVGKSGIGMGDIVFYSIIAMIAFSVSSVTGAEVSGVIWVGVAITFYMLRSGSKIALPGLPIPMLFAFLVLAAAWIR